jgi:hypothetical protein
VMHRRAAAMGDGQVLDSDGGGGHGQPMAQMAAAHSIADKMAARTSRAPAPAPSDKGSEN